MKLLPATKGTGSRGIISTASCVSHVNKIAEPVHELKTSTISQINLLGVSLFGVLIGVFILRKRILYENSNKQGDVDYRSFFVIGLTYIGAGVALSVSLRNPGFFGISGIGIVYMFIGLKNQDKW